MKTVVLSGLVFALCASSLALVLPLAIVLSSSTHRPNPLDDFLLAGYVIAVSASLRTAGFVIATAPSSAWRSMARKRAILISGAMGLLSPVASLLVLAAGASLVLQLFHSAPRLAVVVMHGVPGLLLGALAVLIARISRLRPGEAR